LPAAALIERRKIVELILDGASKSHKRAEARLGSASPISYRRHHLVR